jgi:hypothetical protein
MSKLTGAALDKAVANAMGLVSVKDCEKWDYTNPVAPNLYRIGGEYMAGLGSLGEVEKCYIGYPNQPHQWENDKCTQCGLERKLK